MSISILVILITISFLWFKNYKTDSRDANRIQTLRSKEKDLEFFYEKNRLYPTPSSPTTLYSSGILIGYQWVFDDAVAKKINSTAEKDPLDNEYYTYSIDQNSRKFAILGLFENKNNLSWISPTYAGYENRIGKTFWKNGYILTDAKNTPINLLNLTSQDVKNITSGSKAFMNNKVFTASGINFTSLWYANAKNCNDVLSAWYTIDQKYYLNLTWNTLTEVTCDMTSEWGGWTRISYTLNGVFSDVTDINIDTSSFSKMYYKYKRNGINSNTLGFTFDKLYSKQCGIEIGDKNDLKKWVQDYVNHILWKKILWNCDRISTPGDENLIQIHQVSGPLFTTDSCVSGSLIKNDERNYSFWLLNWNNRIIWWHQHRLSDLTILFWPRGEGSSRCAGVPTPSATANEIELYAK